MVEKREHRVVLYVVLVILSILALTPMIWAISSSLQSDVQIFENLMPFSWKAFIPINPTLSAYRTLFIEKGFGRALLNSFIVSIATVVAGVLVNSMCGFAFAVFEFKGKKVLFFLALVSFMIPFEAIAIPLYQVVNRLNLIDTYWALILPAISNGLAIFLFRQFFMDIPKDYIDAGRIDGASWWTVFAKIYVPLAKPVVISAALILFLFQWEAFLWPLIAARDSNLQVIQVAIAGLNQENLMMWSQMFAASVVAVIIPVVLILPLQQYYVQGVTGAGIKG
mgnify:CR=1 FL=1|jgi:multiple sugar transport system permease protein